MDTNKNGGAAFPVASPGGSFNEGMTLRDYFAAQAMGALVSGSYVAVAEAAAKKKTCVESYLSGAAYEIADAMIEERAK